MVFFKCLTNFAISKREIVVPIVPDWRCYDCSTVRLLQLLHGETVTIVPQWDCCNCSTVRPLWFFYNWTVTNVPQWHCYDCSTVALLRLLHGYTVTIVPQWQCYDCSPVRVLRQKFYGLLILFHSEIHCWRIATCTRNTTHDP